MRWYWVKIAVGAVAIFLVGYAGVWVVRTQVSRGRHLIESSDPITIPLAFLPFNIDGQRLGTFQRVTVRRDAPDVVGGLDLRVRVGDSLGVARLRECRLAMADRNRFDVKTGFRCLSASESDSGMVRFGEVQVSNGDAGEFSIPLMLDSAIAADLKKKDRGVHLTTQGFGQGEGAAARAEADRIRVEVSGKADSIAAAVRQQARQRNAPPAKPN